MIKGLLASTKSILGSTLSPGTGVIFLGRLFLVRSLMVEARISWCYLPIESPRFCKSPFPMYWSKNYFKWYTRSYCTKLGFLSLDKMKMKEEI